LFQKHFWGVEQQTYGKKSYEVQKRIKLRAHVDLLLASRLATMLAALFWTSACLENLRDMLGYFGIPRKWNGMMTVSGDSTRGAWVGHTPQFLGCL